MAKWMKEDEKIEKEIRALLKLPENRRCINCNSLGTQYVCTTFLTFVCTNCSGVHREFTHRVKSVSVAKFSAEEVSALQAGGNERARKIYFKEWDSQRHSFPDSSNIHKLRDFIKHVYVGRKYTGEISVDKLPRLKLSDEKESYEYRKVGADTYQKSHSEKSSPVAKNDEKSFRYYYDERRSPRYAQDNSRYGGYRRSPARLEVIDDRFRDDGFGSGRRTAIHRFSSGESKLGIRSPDCQKNMDRFRSPVVRPVRDILGENVPPLLVGDPPKANEGRDVGGSAHNQKLVSSSDSGSADRNPVELKRVNSGSLIHLGSDPKPPDAAAVPQTQQVPPSIDGGNWASFTSSEKEKASHAPNANTLESLLFQLAPLVVPAGNITEVPRSGYAPSTAPVGNMLMLPAGNMPEVSSSGDAPSTEPAGNMVTSPAGGVSPATPVGVMPALPSRDCASITISTTNLPSMQQHQPSTSPSADSSSTAQQTTLSVGAFNDQPWNSSMASNAQGPSGASSEQSFQAISKPAQDNSSGVGLQPLPVDAKSSGRKEFPADLFTASYSPIPAPVPGWQTGPHHAMRFGMVYQPTAVPVPAFPNSAKSTNPFDLNDETNQVQIPTFPSMASLQGALPNVHTCSNKYPIICHLLEYKILATLAVVELILAP
ncbi:hypothetical protein L1049_017831 [Liquidambar formosana]|uniref:Arf-GAP domain-containing protein n=1 Tax=Liquidambar formosana TaxID=63359 RepID=A0AAP0NME9_LIQFO